MSSGEAKVTKWQDRLNQVCVEAKLGAPIFQLKTEPRGDQTAFSSRVRVAGRHFSAHFWYSREHINNAKEDAAEVALKCLESFGVGLQS